MAIPKSRTALDNILVHGIDQKNRIIHFGLPVDGMEYDTGDFVQASVEVAVRAIISMSIDSPNKPISIYMNSYGGDPYAMNYMKDVMLASPCQFKFYGGGAIMSAATWILAVSDERYLYKDATVMVHTGWEEQGDRYNDFHIGADESKRLMDLLYDCYAENSSMPKQFWRDLCQRDLYLTSEESVVLGLADKVVEPKRRGNLRKMRTKHLSKPNQTKIRRLTKELYERVEVNPPGQELKVNAPPVEQVDDSLVIDDTPVEVIDDSPDFSKLIDKLSEDKE